MENWKNSAGKTFLLWKKNNNYDDFQLQLIKKVMNVRKTLKWYRMNGKFYVLFSEKNLKWSKNSFQKNETLWKVSMEIYVPRRDFHQFFSCFNRKEYQITFHFSFPFSLFSSNPPRVKMEQKLHQKVMHHAVQTWSYS